MYYGSGTVDRIASRQPVNDAAHEAVGARQTRVCTHPMATLFCVKYRHAHDLQKCDVTKTDPDN